MKSVLLRGLQPQPLASYFGAIGVFRLVAEQLAGGVRGRFTPEGFELLGVNETELTSFLLERYAPTPILSPWNGGSGFAEGDNTEALEALRRTTEPRFALLRSAIEQVLQWPELPPRGLSLSQLQARLDEVDARKLSSEIKTLSNAPPDVLHTQINQLTGTLGKAARKVFTSLKSAHRGRAKPQILSRARAELPEPALAWLDAVVVQQQEPDWVGLFGTGGNEGRQEYSKTYLASLRSALLGTLGGPLLRGTLFAELCSGLGSEAAGQFAPGVAGGANMRADLSDAAVPTNPWTFILLMEGLCAWASSAARRNGTGRTYASTPFTVAPLAAGHGSAVDGESVRDEVWVPVWSRPASYPEFAYFVREGRAEAGERQVRTAVDLIQSIRSLGVDRGVDEFVRYTIAERRGQGYYVATPTARVVVGAEARSIVDLLRQLDGNLDRLDQFFSRFASEQGAPAQLRSARRAVNEARFDVAARGGPETMIRLVRAIGALEMLLAKRDPGKDPRLFQPLGGLGPEWVEHCGDSPEVRIAAALASLGAWSGAAPWRAYVAPVEPDNVRRSAPAARTLAWSGSSLAERLTNVLHRRILDARRGARGLSETRSPTWGARVARLGDLAMFLAPDLVDETAIEELLFGFTWVRLHGHGGTGRGDDLPSSAPPLARAYCLLKLLFLPHGFSVAGSDEPILIDPDPNLLPLLRSGRVGEALELAARQLRARALRPRQVAPRASDQSWRDELGLVDAAWGQRLAAALLIPVWESRRLLELALIQDSSDQQNDRTAQETTDAE